VCADGSTSAAENEARTQEHRGLTLANLEKLFDLWAEHYAKLSETDKELLLLRAVYYQPHQRANFQLPGCFSRSERDV
jgi:restriction system protein